MYRATTTDQADKDAKRSEIMERLEAAIDAIHDSESFRRYLTMQARLHSYSFNNTILIAWQRPDASCVAGYNAWQAIGRQVRKGEKGIAIIVPWRRNRPSKKDPDAEESIIGFGTGYVFDISQTDGDELPAIAVPVLDNAAGAELFAQLADLAGAEGVTLAEQPASHFDGDVMGYYQPATRAIAVRTAAPLQMVKTLAHELAHHFTGRHETYGEERAEHETIAESVAYIVLAYFGLDSGERSFPYIATWSEERAAFRAALGEIQRVAAHMIDALTAAAAATIAA